MPTHACFLIIFANMKTWYLSILYKIFWNERHTNHKEIT